MQFMRLVLYFNLIFTISCVIFCYNMDMGWMPRITKGIRCSGRKFDFDTSSRGCVTNSMNYKEFDLYSFKSFKYDMYVIYFIFFDYVKSFKYDMYVIYFIFFDCVFY